MVTGKTILDAAMDDAEAAACLEDRAKRVAAILTEADQLGGPYLNRTNVLLAMLIAELEKSYG